MGVTLFGHEYIHGERPVYTSTKPPNFTNINDSITMTELTEPYAIKIRYNPDKDTGDGNVAFFTPNSQYTQWKEPDDPNRKIYGLPLWVMLWGWADWNKKTKRTTLGR